jgi:hypothetical protein
MAAINTYMTLDDLNDRISAATDKYEAALNDFVVFCDNLRLDSLDPSAPLMPWDEYQRLSEAASKAEEERDFEIVLFRIAEEESMDKAMLYKLTHGGAQ